MTQKGQADNLHVILQLNMQREIITHGEDQFLKKIASKDTVAGVVGYFTLVLGHLDKKIEIPVIRRENTTIQGLVNEHPLVHILADPNVGSLEVREINDYDHSGAAQACLVSMVMVALDPNMVSAKMLSLYFTYKIEAGFVEHLVYGPGVIEF